MRARALSSLAFASLAMASGAAWSLPAASASPTAAKSSTTRFTVGDSAEAWYASEPVVNCGSPLGCLPVSPPPAYPSSTLHVGEVEASETARLYLTLDLAALPSGARAVSGTLTLPVSSGPNDGNLNASSGEPDICLAAAPITDGVSGSTSTPPSIDCSTDVVAGYGATGVFTADITRFLQAWNSGTPDFGLAVVPVPGESASSAWQVSINGRRLAGVPHISATLSLTGLPGAVMPLGSGIGPLVPAVPASPAAPSSVPTPLAGGVPATARSTSATPVSLSGLPSGAPRTGGSPASAASSGPLSASTLAQARPALSLPALFLWFPLVVAVAAIFTIRTFINPVSHESRVE